MTMILFTSSALVREREQGNMEFLITTPVRSIELMVGKTMPYVLVGLAQVAIILGVINSMDKKCLITDVSVVGFRSRSLTENYMDPTLRYLSNSLI